MVRCQVCQLLLDQILESGLRNKWFNIEKKSDRNFLFVNLLHSSILVLRLKRSKTTPYARNVERPTPRTELTLKCTESAALLSGENETNFAFWLKTIV